MNSYPENYPVTLTFPLKWPDGSSFTPGTLYAFVYDAESQLMTNIDIKPEDIGVDEVKVIVPSGFNIILTSDVADVRIVEVLMTEGEKTYTARQSYILDRLSKISTMNGSFMGLETAKMLAKQVVNLSAFNGETEERQVAALMEAFWRITKLTLRVEFRNMELPSGAVFILDENGWEQISEDALLNYFPKSFARDLRLAQLVEADEILRGSVIANKHRDGIASETIGESSVTFRAGFAGASGSNLSATALTYLSRYIDRSVRLVRA